MRLIFNFLIAFRFDFVSEALHFRCRVFRLFPHPWIPSHNLPLLWLSQHLSIVFLLSLLIACLHFFFRRGNIDYQVMRSLILMQAIVRLTLTGTLVCDGCLLPLLIKTVFFGIVHKFFIVVVVRDYGGDLSWRGRNWLMRMLIE